MTARLDREGVRAVAQANAAATLGAALVEAIAPFVHRLIDERLRDQSASADGLLSIEKAAARLDMSVGYIRKAIRSGQLPKLMVGRCVRVRIADVDALATRVSTKRDDVAERRARILRVAGGQP